MKSVAVLVDVGDRHRELAADFAIDADRVLVGARRARLAIEQQVDLGIDDRDEARVVAGGRIERPRRRRRRPGMEWLELSGQHALAEAAVAGSQDRPAIGGRACIVTPSRGERCSTCTAVPRPGTIASVSCPCRIERRQVLTDGATVIEAQSGIDRQPIAHGDARRWQRPRP